jgi:hypothetical protein
MRGRAFVAVMLALISGCSSAPRPMPAGEKFADDLMAGRVDLEQYDFAAAGYWALPAEQRLIWKAPIEQRLYSRQLTSQTCDRAEHRRFAAAMWMQLLGSSPDEASWRARWTALRKALRAHDADVLVATKTVARGVDARVTELARRVAQDQVIRDPHRDSQWAADLPDAARGSWFALKLARMTAIDCRNTEWLASQMREIGWFDATTYGATADKDAWLLVQHADRSPDFQRSTLAHLRTLGPDQTSPRNVAYLEDRVATAQNRPQRYGTQGSCDAEGRWSPGPIEDPAGVDARRAVLGLEPMAEYSKRFEGVCPKMPPTALP